MKQILMLLLTLSFVSNMYGQLVKDPDIRFVGSKLEWVHTVKDSFYSPFEISFLEDDRGTGSIISPTIEIHGKIILNVGRDASLINAYDLKSGDHLWEYNAVIPTNQNFKYDLRNPMTANEGGNLLLNGITFEYARVIGSNGFNEGKFVDLVIDINTGKTLNTFLSKSPVRTHSFGQTTRSKETNIGKTLFLYNAYIPKDKDFRLYPVKFELPNEEVAEGYYFNEDRLIKLEVLESATKTLKILGPFTKDQEIFTFLAGYNQNDTTYQCLWRTDSDANIIDIQKSSFRIGDFYESAVQNDSLILLSTYPINGNSGVDFRGYTLMDMEGKIVRQNSKIVISDKVARFVATTTLNGTEDLLHVISFYEDKDVYVFKETKNTQYTQLAHLINPNSEAYIFRPRFVFQSSDEGIVISGLFILDTVSTNISCKLCVVWPVVMKLSAETLGLTVATTEVKPHLHGFTMTPNPTTESVQITIEDGSYRRRVHIKDGMGRTVITQEIVEGGSEIDIAGLSSGIYFVSVTDAQGRSVGQWQKLVKL